MKTDIYFWSYLSQCLQWKMFQTGVLEKIKTHILDPIFFFRRIFCSLWDNVEKYIRVGQVADDNTPHALCTQDT